MSNMRLSAIEKLVATMLLALPIVTSTTANSQDSSAMRRCLSIVDVNERVDCLERSNSPNLNSVPDNRVNIPQQPQSLPSFDCRTAKTSVEHTICSDASLADLDGQMGRVFQQVMRSTRDRQASLEGQRLWLAQRDRRCASLPADAMKSCITEMTKSRAASLAVSPSVPNAPSVADPMSDRPSPRPTASTSPSVPIVAPSSVPNLAPAQPTSSQGRASQNNDSTGFGLFVAMILGLIAVIGFLIWKNVQRHRTFVERQRVLAERRQNLIERFGLEIAEKILAEEIWQGMTEEQLVESWGWPEDKSDEVIKSKIKETWKYDQTGKNRFRRRVYLEDGFIIGWKNS